jgi:hypothetical protein
MMLNRDAAYEFLRAFNIDPTTLDTVKLNKALLALDISPIPESEKVLEFIEQLGVTGITLEELELALADIDLETLQYDRTEVVAFLEEFGVDTTNFDATTFDAVLGDLGISKVPEADKIL